VKNTTQVLQAIPPAKAAEKKSRTIQGVALGVLGCVMALTSFAVTIRLVWTGATIDKWSVVLATLPLVGGIFMVAYGSHIASGELSRAALKDITAAVRAVIRKDDHGASGGGS
jgi:hypothetical protein